MSAEYLVRLACLSLASFLAVYVPAGLCARLAARWFAAAASRMDAHKGADRLLILRWTPLALALFVVMTVCIPSYLWLEPGETGEELGWICIAAATLTLASWIAAVFSGARKLRQSRAAVRRIESGENPVLALAGFRSPRVVISPSISGALPADQLDAAVRHELAHRDSRDNLKRLVLAFTPGLLPGINGFSAIERQWVRLSEWAADDAAVAGDTSRAFALASALVAVARLGASPVPLASSMLDGDDLAYRVERLLRPAPPAPSRPFLPVPVWTICLGVTALLALLLRPATLESAHRVLERLVN